MVVATSIPTPMQSTNTAHRKKATKPPKDRFKARAKRTLEPASDAASRSRKAGSSLAHWSFVPNKFSILP